MNRTFIAAVAIVWQAIVSAAMAFDAPKAKPVKAPTPRGKVDSKVLAARQAKAAACDFVNKGVPLLEDGQYDAAIELFSKAIAAYPKLAKAYRCRGVALDYKGEHDRAIAELNRAVELEPNDENNVFPRGCAYFHKGDFARAIEDFNFLDNAMRANLGSRTAYVYRYRGRCWFRLGKADKALADFDEAIRLNPDLANAYSYRGELLVVMGENERALADLSRAIELDAEDAWPANARGCLYLMRGAADKAIADCNEAIRRDPKLSYAYQTRGAALLLKHDFAASLLDSTKAIELSAHQRPWPFINRAIAWAVTEEYAKAIHDLETALDLAPDHEDANLLLAYLCAACVDARYRDARRAMQLATKACELTDWKDSTSLDVLSMAHAEAAEFAKAADCARQALAIAARDSDHPNRPEELKRRIELYRAGQPFREKLLVWSGGFGLPSSANIGQDYEPSIVWSKD